MNFLVLDADTEALSISELSLHNRYKATNLSILRVTPQFDSCTVKVTNHDSRSIETRKCWHSHCRIEEPQSLKRSVALPLLCRPERNNSGIGEECTVDLI